MPLPAGYVLDDQPTGLPPGYVLDTPKAKPAPKARESWWKAPARWAEQNIVRPGLEYGGLAAGAIVGGAGGTAIEPGAGTALGGVAGAGLGYSMGKQAADLIEEQAGLKTPERLPQRLGTAASDVATGAELEMGGQVAGKVAGKAAGWAGRRAQGLYQSALKPSTTYSIEDIEDMGEAGMKRNVPPVREARPKLRKITGDLAKQVDDILTPGAERGDTLSRETTLTRLNSARKQFQHSGAREEDLAIIDKVAERVRRDYPERIPVKEAQALKKGIYQRVYEETQGGKVERATYKQVARGIKEELEKLYPEIGGPNRELGPLLELDTAIEQAVKREGNKDVHFNNFLNKPRVKVALARALRAVGKLAPGEALPGHMAPQQVAQAGMAALRPEPQAQIPGPGAPKLLPWQSLPPGQDFTMRAPEEVSSPYSPRFAASVNPQQLALPEGQTFTMRPAEEVSSPYSPELAAKIPARPALPSAGIRYPWQTRPPTGRPMTSASTITAARAEIAESATTASEKMDQLKGLITDLQESRHLSGAQRAKLIRGVQRDIKGLEELRRASSFGGSE